MLQIQNPEEVLATVVIITAVLEIIHTVLGWTVGKEKGFTILQPVIMVMFLVAALALFVF